MFHERIRYAPLRDKITNPATAASHIKDGSNLFISGLGPVGYPKLVLTEVAKRARSGERLRLNLYPGASIGEDLDDVLAEAGVVAWRRPYMSAKAMRQYINRGEILYRVRKDPFI